MFPIFVQPFEFIEGKTGMIVPIGALELRGPSNAWYVRAFPEPSENEHGFQFMSDGDGPALLTLCLN
jgi:hypothetical protein